MTFWGIEVRPGKPYTHRYNKDGGRLHISQATLSFGGSASTKRSVVQCNVGKSRPILLCSLSLDKLETCPLDLEFHEAEEVIFSVLGPQSIYLTGYYLNLDRHHLNRYDDDSDSYGENIAETESDPSRGSEKDDYDTDDSFINDGDPEEQSSLPHPKTKSEDESFLASPISTTGRKKKCNSRRKHLKKKYQVSDSDEVKDASQRRTTMKKSIFDLSSDSEDEDTCLLSSLIKSKTFVKNEKVDKTSITKTAEDGKQEKAEDDGSRIMCSKRKIDTVIGERILDKPCNPSLSSDDDGNRISGTPKKKKKKKIVDHGKNLDDRMHIYQVQPIGNCKSDIYKENGQCKEIEIKSMGEELTIGDEMHRKLPNNDIVKLKKQKKEKANKHIHAITEEDDSKDLNKKKKEKANKHKHTITEEDDSKDLESKEPYLQINELDPIMSNAQESNANLEDQNEKLKKKHKKRDKNKARTIGDDVSKPLQSKSHCLENMELDQQVDSEQRSNADPQNEKIHGLEVDKVGDENDSVKRKKKGKSKSYKN